jgi:UDP-2,3-diacylglucosamine pyrophosphatase LpxH
MKFPPPVPEPEKTVVISDVHMSNAEDYSWFLPPYPQDLTELLNRLAADSSLEELVFLGDLFDLWVYPLHVVPWTVKRIIAANQPVTQAIQNCVQQIKNVYYITGNHDMGVTADDLQVFSSGDKRLQLISPEWYRQHYKNQRHLEHGHQADMFNAPPDDPDDTIGGYPLGFFITRLTTTAKTARERAQAGQALKSLLQTHSARAQKALRGGAVEARAMGSYLVTAIIDLLQKHAGVSDSEPIRFSEPQLDNKYTVGAIKEHYGKLFGTWLKRYPDWRDFANTMLVWVNPDGLNWYADKLLAAAHPPQVVLLGHSHHPIALDRYKNDGRWCHSSPWGLAGEPPYYIEIVGDTAQLKSWKESG